MQLTIAGYQFDVWHDPSMVFEETDAVYAPFVSDAQNATELRVPTRLEVGALPDLNGMKKLFDSGVAWSLFRNGSSIAIQVYAHHLGRPILVARVENPEGATSVQIDFAATGTGDLRTVLNPLRYPVDQVILMHLLASRRGVLVHCAGLTVDGAGIIFPGRSGAGKSTLSRLFDPRDPQIVRISDDRIVVRGRGHGEFDMSGTPWPGEARIALHQTEPLKALCFLHKSPVNEIRRISPSQAWPQLLPVCSIPWYDRRLVPASLDLCNSLLSCLPLYELHFRPDQGAADLVKSLHL